MHLVFFSGTQKTKEIFVNLIQTLSSSRARVLNLKACRVQGRSPGKGFGGRSPLTNFFVFDILSVRHNVRRYFVCRHYVSQPILIDLN